MVDNKKNEDKKEEKLKDSKIVLKMFQYHDLHRIQNGASENDLRGCLSRNCPLNFAAKINSPKILASESLIETIKLK